MNEGCNRDTQALKHCGLWLLVPDFEFVLTGATTRWGEISIMSLLLSISPSAQYFPHVQKSRICVSFKAMVPYVKYIYPSIHLSVSPSISLSTYLSI